MNYLTIARSELHMMHADTSSQDIQSAVHVMIVSQFPSGDAHLNVWQHALQVVSCNAWVLESGEH